MLRNLSGALFGLAAENDDSISEDTRKFLSDATASLIELWQAIVSRIDSYEWWGQVLYPILVVGVIVLFVAMAYAIFIGVNAIFAGFFQGIGHILSKLRELLSKLFGFFQTD